MELSVKAADLRHSTSPYLHRSLSNNQNYTPFKNTSISRIFLNVPCAYFTLFMHDVLFKDPNQYLFTCTFTYHITSMLCPTSRATAFFLLELTLDCFSSYPLMFLCTYLQRNKRRIKKWNKKQNLTFSKLKSKIWHETKIICFSPTTSLNADYKIFPSTYSLVYVFMSSHTWKSCKSECLPEWFKHCMCFAHLQCCLCSAMIL